MKIQRQDIYSNYPDYGNYKNNSFHARNFERIGKNAEKIFTHLENECAETGGHTVEELRTRLRTFVSQLDPDIKFDYKNPGLTFDKDYGLKVAGDFFFKNMKTGKKVYAASPVGYHGIVPGEDTLHIKSPQIPERVYVDWYHNEDIDDLQKDLSGNIMYGGDGISWVPRSQVRWLIVTIIQKMLSVIPVFRFRQYESADFERMVKFINDLTTKIKPEEINKRLQ